MGILTVLIIARGRPLPPWLPPWAPFAVFLALGVLVAVLAARQQRKRREGLAQFALESGFLFAEEPDSATAAELAQTEIKTANFQRRVRFRNLLRGSTGGLDTIIADRTVGAGKNQSTSTIVAYKFGTPFPAFMLCGENVLWHIAEKLGYSDIDIDGAPDFSQRFFLHGEDQNAIRALFRPEVTQAFSQMQKDKAPNVNAAGPWLIMHRPNRIVAPKDLRDLLQEVQPIAEAFRRVQTGSVFR